jgi:hypothetical protein
MNPAHGAQIERARQAEEDERMGGARGKAVHRVEIECADGGYVARLHRPGEDGRDSGHVHRSHPGQGADRDEEGRFKPGEAPAARPSVHVFTNHNDLVDFLREELGAAEK